MSSQNRVQSSEHRVQGIFSALCTLITVLSLSACGFHPLYGKKETGSVSQLTAGVRIDPIPGRDGQLFKIALEDRLNPGGVVPGNAAYRLHVTFTNSESAIGVSRDGTVSRYNVYVTSTYALYRVADGKAITSGSLSHVGSYNNLINSYFSTYVSEEDAVKRGITELSELYRQRLAAYLDAGAPEQKIKEPVDEDLVNPWQPQPWQSNAPTAPQQRF